MPAGNDAADASRELVERFEVQQTDVAALISSNKMRRRDVTAAQRTPKDEEATAKLDLAEVARAAGVQRVVKATVRGKYVVYVYHDDTGRKRKGVLTKAAPSRRRRRRAQAAPEPPPAPVEPEEPEEPDEEPEEPVAEEPEPTPEPEPEKPKRASRAKSGSTRKRATSTRGKAKAK